MKLSKSVLVGNFGEYKIPKSIERLWLSCRLTRVGRPDRRTKPGREYLAWEAKALKHERMAWLSSRAFDLREVS